MLIFQMILILLTFDHCLSTKCGMSYSGQRRREGIYLSIITFVLSDRFSINETSFLAKIVTSNHIYSGEQAYPGDFPWMVSIQAFYEMQWTQWCGGSILNENWIITGNQT